MMSDRAARAGIAVLLAVLAAAALANCAHLPPVHLWELCRDECGKVGGSAAAVVGSTKPKPGEKPACMCGAPAPAGGGT